jgi:hypothetical protein
MGGSVFLSHASDDKEKIVSLGLIQALQGAGLTVFVDSPERFPGLPRRNMKLLVSIGLGEMWRRDLGRLLEKANVILACWSNNYVSRLAPIAEDLRKGEYLRDEIVDARAADYLAHVVVDRVDRFPVPYSTLKNDQQLLNLFELGSNSWARKNGIERLVQLISKIITRRQLRELGPQFESDVATALRFIDRSAQEEPLQPHISEDFASGLYILFGQKSEDPDQLYERFREFTMPARDEYLNSTEKNWRDILIGYMSSSLVLEPWQKSIIVNWPRAEASPHADLALARIADQLALALPRLEGQRSEKPLQRVLQTISYASKHKRRSIFAYSFIEAKRWANERASICAVINALGKELVQGSVDSFRFLVVIETPGIRRGGLRWWFQRILGRISSSEEFGKENGGPSSIDLNGQPIWHRLPDLAPLKSSDFIVWAGLLADAWGLDALAARQSLRDRFVREISLGPASKDLRDNVLPDLWLRSKLAKHRLQISRSRVRPHERLFRPTPIRSVAVASDRLGS